MQALWTKALAHIESRWHTLSGGILAALAAVVFTFFGLHISGVFTLLPVIILSIAAGIITIGFWASSNRIPKVPPNTIAVVVGLACDTPAHQKQVTADFVDELAKTLRHGDTRFSFTELPSWILPRLKNDGMAFKLFSKTRAHLMVFGTVRERNVKGRSAHLLSLRGLVRHAPVSPEIQKLISDDFNKVLPEKIVIDKADDALTFELHSDRIGTGARYIVGLAAFVSGDLGLAEQLFLQVEQKLTEDKLKGSQPGAFLKQVRIRLHELYTVWLKALYDAYYTSRERASSARYGKQ